MKLNALLVSRDRPSLRMLVALLDVLQIEHQICHSSAAAVELLVKGHHSALVLDFDLPGAGQVARTADHGRNEGPERLHDLLAGVPCGHVLAGRKLG